MAILGQSMAILYNYYYSYLAVTLALMSVLLLAHPALLSHNALDILYNGFTDCVISKTV